MGYLGVMNAKTPTELMRNNIIDGWNRFLESICSRRKKTKIRAT
jgi:hypothetical protein